MAMNGPQAQQKPVQFTGSDISALADYVASLAPGPGIPNASLLDTTQGNAANGGELFRTNCAMCHNVAGAGGALTEGKFAPALSGVSAQHIYEAMVTGPQNMPVFNDSNISPSTSNTSRRTRPPADSRSATSAPWLRACSSGSSAWVRSSP
jgi:ubiquinol-cytochrome c reductase cytochrome c subunit